MSTRHRSADVKPARPERRADHHRERRATRRALACEPEDVVDPRPRHGLHQAHPERPHQQPPPLSAHRARHWEQPFWKRRTVRRHERNRRLAEMQDA